MTKIEIETLNFCTLERMISKSSMILYEFIYMIVVTLVIFIIACCLVIAFPTGKISSATNINVCNVCVFAT